MILTISANKVSDPTEDLSIPIGDVAGRGYVHTVRGMQSVEHLLLLARAHLIARSRAVETSVTMGFREALRLLSLRKAMIVEDNRLPGGEATGKIIKSSLTIDGDTGAAVGVITCASCVGKGGSHSTSPGTPSYVDDTLDGTQEYFDVIVLTDTDDIAWSIAPYESFDDGLDFAAGLNTTNAVKLASISNPAATQRVLIEEAGEGPDTDQAAISQVLQENPTQITIQMKPMEGGPFQKEVVVSVSDLVVPKQIDLEAPSNA